MSEQSAVELDIPSEVMDAEQAVEVMRAWIADGALVLTLESEAFGDQVSDWGRLLAEVAHHIAKAQALQGTMPESEALEGLKAAFDQAFPSQSQKMTGEIKGRVRH